MRSDAFDLPGQGARLAQYQSGVVRALRWLGEQKFPRRLWERDAQLWSRDAAVQAKIRNRLGWLTAPDRFQQERERIEQFVRGLQQEGFTHALLLGMGGSVMCPEVCRTTFGVPPSFLDLLVLDTTDPATIRAREQALKLGRTLFIVSSKSGTTTETLSLYKYFYDRVRALKGDAAGENFIAITDPETPLAREAHERRFRDAFLNPADIGGRFSGLSFFGLVPAALIGVDLRTLLERAQQMARACGPDVPVQDNPGVVLGGLLGQLYSVRRDKLTFVLDPGIASFGYWVEQLIAESLGKIGKGIVPVEGEPVGGPSVYGRDRVFVRLRLASSEDRQATDLRRLARAGHPIIELDLGDKFDLAAEFYRWEIATAAAGTVMRLNPFDEPNVQESKDNTDRLLGEFRSRGRLPEETPSLQEGPLRVFVPAGLRRKLVPSSRPPRLAECVRAFLRLARVGDYLGLTAYIQNQAEHQRLLQELRVQLRDRFRRAITLGYGPRFLHSTGQLHKGGPNNGLYFQLVAEDEADVPVPGEPYTFSVLKQAQALGDFVALENKRRRVFRIHLGQDIEKGLRKLAQVASRAATAAGRPRPAREPRRKRRRARKK